MIVLALAALLGLQGAPAPAPVLGPIGRQTLPAKGCAVFLWDNQPKRELVAMAVADPATIRLRLDGATVDVARAAEQGPAGFGFSGITEYRGEDVTAVLDMTVETRRDLSGGAVVPAATLRVERPGRDTLIAPVAGLIGCGG
jgi:hypothetical protein